MTSSSVSHLSLLLGSIPKLTDNNKVDWNLGLKTYLKGRKLWKHFSRDTSNSSEDLKDFDKVEQPKCEQETTLKVIRATIPPTRLPAITGIEGPKISYELLFAHVSQDDGLEVAG